jgi:pyruvate/2-oxoglutarate/acetoin dehydrogenase E1 component
VAELTYRAAVVAALTQEMERDTSVVFLGEDVAAAGGVFKATPGLLEQFGPVRVRDTPIAEQAILGLAMGAAMTGLKPVAEIMFSDFFAVCWDLIANEIAKTRYMSNGQVTLPLVIRTANGGGIHFGAQHSQSVENWAMMIPGLKVVAPSNAADMKGLLAGAIRDPDPVIVFEHKNLYATKADVPAGEYVLPLGKANIVHAGSQATVVALAAMVPVALRAAEILEGEGIAVTVIDLRCLVPLDTETILGSVRETGWLFTVEENPRLCGWGAEIASIAAEEAIDSLSGPIVRITSPHLPLPAAEELEALVLPSPERVADTIRRTLR